MDHISYIDEILYLKKDSFDLIPEFSLTIDSTTYTINKKLKENLFIGQTSDSNYLIQVFPTADFPESDLKHRESMIPVINGLAKSIHKLPDQYIILCKQSRRISLQEYFEYKRDPRIPKTLRESTELCVDVIIKALQEIISSVSSLEKHEFVPVSLDPSEIYIEITQTPLHPIFLTDSLGIEIKIDLITSMIYKLQIENPLKGLALCIFSALKNKLCSQINLESKRLKNPKSQKGYPFALCGLISSLLEPQAKAEEILFSPFVSTWIFLFKDNDSIPLSTVFDIDALLSGLYFKNKTSRTKAVFSMISQEKETLIEIIKAKPCFHENSRRIIKTLSRVKNWARFMSFAESTVRLLNELIDEKALFEAGPLKIFKALNNPKITLDLITKICSSKTMTAACILSSSRVMIDKIAENEKVYLKVIPYMGLHSISYLSESTVLGPYEKLRVLSKIPINIKRTRTQDVFEIIIKNFPLSTQKTSITRTLTKVVKIIREVLHDGKLAHDYNKSGRCFKNEKKLNSSALMVYCSKCTNYMCLVCGSSHTEIHNIKHLKYVHSSELCKKSGESFELLKDVFALNEIDLQFFDSRGNISNNGVFASENSSEEVSVTTTENITTIFDESSHSTLLYYEVEIINAGTSENISIGVDGVGIYYTGHNGFICNEAGVVLKQIAKFGTGDIIGIGFTSSHFLYYTYNGYNLHFYTECNNVTEIRPLIRFKGKGIQVRVITEGFVFSQAQFFDQLKSKDEVLETVRKWVSKCDGSEKDLKKLAYVMEDAPMFKDVQVPKFSRKMVERKQMNACKDSCVIS